MIYPIKAGGLLTCLYCVVSLTLASCANYKLNTESNSQTNAKTSNNNQTTDDKKSSAENATVAPEINNIDYNTVNPVLLNFDKLSVELTNEDKQILSQIIDRAKKSKRLTLTGYCDRRQIGNAQAAAVKRATKVKEHLIALGANAPMRIKYITQDADKHAVEIQF